MGVSHLFILQHWSWSRDPEFSNSDSVLTFDLTSLFLTSCHCCWLVTILFQPLCLSAFRTIGSIRQYNFSERATSGSRPGCFCDNLVSNSSASTKADVIFRVRFFSSQAPYHVSRWLHGAKECKGDIFSIIIANLMAFIGSARMTPPALPPRK